LNFLKFGRLIVSLNVESNKVINLVITYCIELELDIMSFIVVKYILKSEIPFKLF
jgi:hypothetical protein